MWRWLPSGKMTSVADCVLSGWKHATTPSQFKLRFKEANTRSGKSNWPWLRGVTRGKERCFWRQEPGIVVEQRSEPTSWPTIDTNMLALNSGSVIDVLCLVMELPNNYWRQPVNTSYKVVHWIHWIASRRFKNCFSGSLATPLWDFEHIIQFVNSG